MEPNFDRFLPQPDFDDHFPDCNTVEDEKAECDCDKIYRQIREDFAMARYELDRGN